MKRLKWIAVWAGSIGLVIGACGDGGGGNDEGGGPGITMSATGISDTDPSATGGEEEDTGEKLDVGAADSGPSGCGGGDLGCTSKIDLLFLIDNSGTMAVEQENLARNFPLLIRQLEGLTDSAGNMVMPDVQIMVTTSDFGNPLCTPFEPPDYTPARGAPINTACTSRIQDFTGLGSNPDVVPEACDNVCPTPVAPDGNFISFGPGGVDNIPDSVLPADIDGDGTDDSAVAQALACIGPQGINGCGYESQLENMLQALNPEATWNQGATKFLRPDALLAIAVVTDEADCSVMDYDIMMDEQFQEIDPDTMEPAPSSAICWNSGVSCNGPDAMGVYNDCQSIDDNGALQPINRYTNYLINELRENQKKEVVMLGILGVPEVTAHNENPPFEPTAGGVESLEIRNWRDGEYPAGDILPDEFSNGVTAADKQADFGVGPGCTGGDAVSGFTGQAIPPVRIREVCEALNIEKSDGTVDVRCCIESICDDDFSAAIRCLTGIIGEAIVAPG
jgi:hypothetical protein